MPARRLEYGTVGRGISEWTTAIFICEDGSIHLYIRQCGGSQNPRTTHNASEISTLIQISRCIGSRSKKKCFATECNKLHSYMFMSSARILMELRFGGMLYLSRQITSHTGRKLLSYSRPAFERERERAREDNIHFNIYIYIRIPRLLMNRKDINVGSVYFRTIRRGDYRPKVIVSPAWLWLRFQFIDNNYKKLSLLHTASASIWRSAR